MESTFAVAALCLIGVLLVMSMIFLASAIRIVREDTRLSVYRLGRYLGDKGPGLVLLIPVIDRGVLKQVGATDTVAGDAWQGRMGETRTTVYTSGKVYVDGREWEAISQSPISAGQRVRVVKIILEVEKDAAAE